MVWSRGGSAAARGGAAAAREAGAEAAPELVHPAGPLFEVLQEKKVG